MRQRDPTHDRRLNDLLTLNAAACKSLVAITDYRDPNFVASEVLASIVRMQFGSMNGVLDASAAALLRRVVAGASARIRRKAAWRDVAKHDSELIREAVSYFWEKFLADEQEVCNAEVRFAVYLNNKVDDYIIHRLAAKNSMESVDGMGTVDEDGREIAYIDTVADPDGETPEEAIDRFELSAAGMTALMKLPRRERLAVYYRKVLDYEWTEVADLLDCSIPTARELMKKGLAALRGALR